MTAGPGKGASPPPPGPPFFGLAAPLFDDDDIRELATLAKRTAVAGAKASILNRAFRWAFEKADYEARCSSKNQVIKHSANVEHHAKALLHQLGCSTRLDDYAVFQEPFTLPAFELIGRAMQGTSPLPKPAARIAETLQAHRKARRADDDANTEWIATYEGLLMVLPTALAALGELASRASDLEGFEPLKRGARKNLLTDRLFAELAGAYEGLFGTPPVGRLGKTGEPCSATVTWFEWCIRLALERASRLAASDAYLSGNMDANAARAAYFVTSLTEATDKICEPGAWAKRIDRGRNLWLRDQKASAGLH